MYESAYKSFRGGFTISRKGVQMYKGGFTLLILYYFSKTSHENEIICSH